MVTFSQGDRGIMEFEYTYPGKYLIHAHKVEFSEKGWVGAFQVNDNQQDPKSVSVEYGT
jgi:FtsP/CotA-like multicopper oxidase with cupredoxin domain